MCNKLISKAQVPFRLVNAFVPYCIMKLMEAETHFKLWLLFSGFENCNLCTVFVQMCTNGYWAFVLYYTTYIKLRNLADQSWA